MCVRTKTSYGCGCEYKTDNECESSECSHLERYHYPRGGDCKRCKEAGSALTRGRDGKGRYGQEISRRADSQEEANESSYETTPGSAEVGNGISPWAQPSPKEKHWMTHSRQKADDAWLEEHAQRNVDLQSIRESTPSEAPSEHDSPVSGSPQRHPRRIYVHEDDLIRDQEHHRRPRYKREDSGRSLPVEIRSPRRDYNQSTQHRVYRRARQDSQESFESVPSSRSSTRKYVPAPTSYVAHEYADVHDSGYGSYGSRNSDTYGRAKTEPYLYSSSPVPRMGTLKSATPQPHGYHTGYVSGPVNVVTRAPTYGYASRRY